MINDVRLKIVGPKQKGERMVTRGKASNKVQDMKGKGKETVGRIVGNKKLERKGKMDQSKSAVKNADEDVKHAASHVKDAITHK